MSILIISRCASRQHQRQVLAALALCVAARAWAAPVPQELAAGKVQEEAGTGRNGRVEKAPVKRFEFGGAGAGAPRRLEVELAEGNYQVRLTLGDEKGDCDTSVKAESRRLMLLDVRTPAGQLVQRSFTVNVRGPGLKSGQRVRLKAREANSLSWDGKLSLEFLGARPGVRAVEIWRDERARTLFIAGDSTVTDQAEEPWAGWGQALPLFFKPGLSVANHAESGESLRSFQAERRLEKITELDASGRRPAHPVRPQRHEGARRGHRSLHRR